MKRLADILLSVAALLLLAACTDDADVYNTPAPSEGNLLSMLISKCFDHYF